MTSTSSVNGLDSYFTSLISNLMEIESQPLTTLETKRDTVNLQVAAYSDLKSMLTSLQDSVYAMMSTSQASSLTAGRSVSVTDQTNDAKILTATASSSAISGTYEINNIVLAKAHRVRSDQFTYIDQDLGLTTGSGYIVVGGADTRSVNSAVTISNTVTGFTTGSVANDLTELGKGSYSVEVRNDSTKGWQFRLLDSNGKAVSIRKSGTADNETSGWQSIPTGGGDFDTGRGLVIQFGTDSNSYQAGNVANSNAAQINYVSQGAHIQIEATDSLNVIASKINNADYAEGDGIAASVVDRQLVLSSSLTGTAHALNATNLIDSGSGGLSGVLHDLGILASSSTDFKNTALQDARNSSFYVNGIHVTRSINSDITDVISGVTLNLASDAEGESASLNIEEDTTDAKDAIDTFIENFNKLQTYLQEKTGVTSTTTDTGTTYTRGTLADDNVFGDLRTWLFSAVMDELSSSGEYSSLRDIGLSFDDDLTLSITDKDKLADALSSNMEDVQTLMDGVMSQIDTRLGQFTGKRSTGDYIDDTVNMMNNEKTDLDQDIKDMNTYLDEKESSLISQYAELQTQLLMLQYSQQIWSSIYGSTNSSA